MAEPRRTRRSASESPEPMETRGDVKAHEDAAIAHDGGDMRRGDGTDASARHAEMEEAERDRPTSARSDGYDRDDTERDRRMDRPAHAGAGPGATAGRSSSWGPVLSGTAIAFVVFIIFSALWLAIAASGAEAVGNNLEWFQLVSGVIAAAAGGGAAGWLDPRGAMTGMMQGLATWGLLIFAVTVAGLATGTALLGGLVEVSLQTDVQGATVTELLQPFETELWGVFAVLIGGALIAGLAGSATGRAHTVMALDDEEMRRSAAPSDVRRGADAGADGPRRRAR